MSAQQKEKCRRKISSGKLFYQLSFLFIISSTIPLIILCSCFYAFSVNAVRKEVENSNQISLRHTVTQIDTYMAEMKRITLEYTSKTYMEQLLVGNLTVHDQVAAFQTFQKQARSTITVNSYIDDIFVCFLNQDLVMSDRGQFSIQTYFEKQMVYANTPAQKWEKTFKEGGTFRLLGNCAVTGTSGTAVKQFYAITMLTTLPAGSGEPGMVIGLVINENALRALLVRADITKPGELFLFNSDATYLSDSIQALRKPAFEFERFRQAFETDADSYVYQESDGTKYVMSFATSVLSGIKVVSMTPYGEITKSVQNVKFFSFVIAGIFIMIGFFLSYLVCSRFCQPIERLAFSMSKNQQPESQYFHAEEYRMICDGFNMVFQKSQQLESTLSRNMNTLRSRLLVEWVNQKHADPDFLRFKMNELDLHFDDPYFYVGVIKFEFYRSAYIEFSDTIENIRSGICSVLKDCGKSSGCEIAIAEIDNEDYVAIVNLKTPDNTALCTEIQQMLHLLDRESHLVHLTFSLSFESGTFEQVPNLFIQAKRLLWNRAWNQGNQLLNGNRHDADLKSIFCYPKNTEDMIINQIIAGNWKEAMATVEQVLEQNINNGLPYIVLSNGFPLLFLTLTKILDQKQIPITDVFESPENIYSELCTISNQESAIAFFEYVYQKVGTTISLLEDRPKDVLMEKIINYLNHNFDHPISLDTISDEIGCTPKYISSLFKKNTGTNFSEYLCRLRIQKAKSLLSDPEVQIKSICALVGFENVNSFDRMFKRYEGISPGQYRRFILQ